MKQIVGSIKAGVVRVYDATHWFTDKEAWGVFRFGAYVEAGFWAYLIVSLGYAAFQLPLAEEVVRFGRSIFGTAYAVYVIFVLIVARSMEWKAGRILMAIFAGIPPFGAIVFERIMARHRQKYPVHIEPPRGADE